jgi:sarcosine oxidase subunit beta
MTQHVDVVVVGAGVVGLSIAYELATRSELSVAVFDKSGPGSGTSGRSAGVICRHDHGPVYQRLSLVGHSRMRAFAAEHGLDFRPWGALSVIREPDTFPPDDPAVRQLQAAPSGLYVDEVLTRDELLERFPWIEPTDVLGGVFQPNTGFINPYQLIDLYRRLLAACPRVTLDYGNPVLELRRAGSRIETIATRRGLWTAATVVNASGAWSEKVSRLAGTAVRITPQRQNVAAVLPVEGVLPAMPLHGTRDLSWEGDGVWCRGETGGTLLFGQHRDKTDVTQPAVDPDCFQSVADPGFAERVAANIEQYYRLPAHHAVAGWTCVYDTSDDGFPIVGTDERVENLVHAVGMNGHGMTIHAGIARCVANLLLTGTTSVDISDVMPGPEKLDFAELAPARFAQGRPLVLFGKSGGHA